MHFCSLHLIGVKGEKYLGNGWVYIHPLSPFCNSAKAWLFGIPLQSFTSWAGFRPAKSIVISIFRNISIWETVCQTLFEAPGDQGMCCFLVPFETDVSWDNSGHILGVWGGEGVANLLRIYRQQKKNG